MRALACAEGGRSVRRGLGLGAAGLVGWWGGGGGQVSRLLNERMSIATLLHSELRAAAPVAAVRY